MHATLYRIAILTFFLCYVGKATAAIPNLAITIPYTGIGIHYNISPAWALEARYLTDKYDSDRFGDITSDVIGLRAQRYLLAARKVWPFIGAETAYVTSKNATYKTSGFASGAFVGAEFFTLRRASFGLDVGPYVVSLEEDRTKVSSTGLEFVINAFINLYVF
ncbi:MAG: hypothetical protein AABZ44_00910 [Elusimicrobiota bacterium]